MMGEYTSIHICGAANTISKTILWLTSPYDQKDFIIYALYNMIAITDLKNNRIICTLKGNDNSVISAINFCYLLDYIIVIVGTEEGIVTIWSHKNNDIIDKQWITKNNSQLKGLIGSISALCSYSFENSFLTVVSSKATIMLWIVDYTSKEPPILFQTIQLPSAQMPKCMSICELPSCETVPYVSLFIGCVDSRIQIYIAKKNSLINQNIFDDYNKFTCVGILSGHEDWINCLSTYNIDNNSLIIASGSQDSKIRIWNMKATPIKSCTITTTTATTTSLTLHLISGEVNADDDNDMDEIEGSSNSNMIQLNEDDQKDTWRLQFNHVDNVMYCVYLESLLVGHEDWITSVQWLPTVNRSCTSVLNTDTNNINLDNMQLFSTSMDRNMVIWSPDTTLGGVWTPKTRMGDIGGALGGSIGGNLLGFVSGTVSPDGFSVIGIGYGGSFHLWRNSISNISSSSSYRTKTTSEDNINISNEIKEGEVMVGYDTRWVPVPFLTGHFNAVNDISWSDSESGDYLTSVSSDQTCRIIAPTNSSSSGGGNDHIDNWKEISRPQIHGYDLNCVLHMYPKGDHTLYTAGEEKNIRVFDIPTIVLDGLHQLCNYQDATIDHLIEKNNVSNRIYKAYIPELGLSNKAYESMSRQEIQEQVSRGVTSIDWKIPPLESQLADYTIWPEINKLFGHVNEIICLAISSDNKWIASSCKARDINTAQIILWYNQDPQVSNKIELATKLLGHESTVVCLEFSPNNRYLVSAGKDRAICIYSKDIQDNNFKLNVCIKNSHKRIIWDCSWSADSEYVLTVSRDGDCKVWKVIKLENTSDSNNDVININIHYSFSPFQGISITAIDISKSIIINNNNIETTTAISTASTTSSYLLLVGNEYGNMKLYSIDIGFRSHQLLLDTPNGYNHGKTVKKLKFRPPCNKYYLPNISTSNSNNIEGIKDSKQYYEWASCSEDRTVRIHRFMK